MKEWASSCGQDAGAEPAAEAAFRRLREQPCFADKSGMLALFARLCGTEGRFACISRPRGFGKSADACLLASGFGPHGGRFLAGLEAERTLCFKRSGTGFQTVFLDMEALLAESRGGEAFIVRLEGQAAACLGFPNASLACALQEVCRHRQGQFVLVVDGWDAPLEAPWLAGPCLARYCALLEGLCRAREAWALVCLFGEAPLERCPGLMAGLPRFASFTMRNPGPLGPWTGMGEPCVRRICQEQGLDFESLLAWHGGWRWDLSSRMFAPVSVAGFVKVRRPGRFFAGPWAETLLADMLAGRPELCGALSRLAEGGRERLAARPGLKEGFAASTTDACLLRLVHAGLLGYRLHTGQLVVPCREVRLCLLEALAGVDEQSGRKARLDVCKVRS